MNKSFKVAIQFENKCGFIEYDAGEKNIKVTFDNQDKRQEIEKYLSCEHTIRIAGQKLMDFSEKTILPSENVDNLKTALTRMWQETGVLVDWSRPV